MHAIHVLIIQILQYFWTDKSRGGLMILEEFADDSIMCLQVTGYFISGAFSVFAFYKKNGELSSHLL